MNQVDSMKESILSNLDNPAQLERLYRADKQTFRRAFMTVAPEIQNNTLVGFWHERLSYRADRLTTGAFKDVAFVILGSIYAAIMIKLPDMLALDPETFYSRNAGLILFPPLAAYFALKNSLPLKSVLMIAFVAMAGLVYVNFLPVSSTSDTLVLSCIHLALFLWCLLGFTFAGGGPALESNWLGYLRYNGEVVVMTGLILIAGFVFSGITVALFSVIGLRIEEFYFRNIGLCGLAAAPIVGTYLTRVNPQLVGRVAPVIARIFSPIVLVMLFAYLVAIVYSGKDPYNDRDFLLLFNALLMGVMAIIFFSVAESSKFEIRRPEIIVLFLLALLTIVVNGIALSAIVFRISEWGFTPNRTAVLGGNVLILVNLLLVTVQLFRVLTRRQEIDAVGSSIVSYLPAYFVWAAIVTFLFPLIFSYR